jgi:NADH-quinone oxidoreductase subunit C
MRLVASSYFTKKFLFSDFSLSNITYFFVRLQDQLRLWIKGITLKRSSLELMVYSQYVYLILLFLQNHTLSKFSSLMDIVAVDYPQRGKNRFELHYVLWSSYFSVPLSIKCFGGNNLSLSSVSSLFNSANWLEREI